MITLYLDEDLSAHQLADALRFAGFSVLTSAEAGMNGQSDEEQLLKAKSTGRVIVSANIRDFVPLHHRYIVSGQTHSGIVLLPQQRFSAGEIQRRLVSLAVKRTSIESELHFLSNY